MSLNEAVFIQERLLPFFYFLVPDIVLVSYWKSKPVQNQGDN